MLADAGVIPQPSIMARSGRGVYLFWLLRDVKDPASPPRAWPEKIELYKKCNRSLNDRLRARQLPADRAAIDAARVLRVPGSVHTAARRRVKYVIQLDENGRGFVYTLPELAKALDIPAPGAELPAQTRELAQPPKYRKTKNPGSAPLRSLGPKKLGALRAQDLLIIQQWRGGFLKRGMIYPDGKSSPGRRFILTLYADFLRGAGETRAATLAALHEMARDMKPPYPSDSPGQDPPLENIIEAAYSKETPRRWSSGKLCALLHVTADVARELDLKTIRPRPVAIEADRERPSQAEYVQERRDFARRYIERYRGVTARRLANAYHAAGFIGANHETANQDLNALGYVMNRSGGGRPRKAPPSPTGAESEKVRK